MTTTKYVIGIDYGSDSVRSVIVDAGTGQEVSSSVHYYSRWQKGLFCNPSANQFRQHPLDYIEGLEITIKDCIAQAGGKDIASMIKGIAVDTTGSTPVAVNEQGIPLALLPGFEENPHAMLCFGKTILPLKKRLKLTNTP